MGIRTIYVALIALTIETISFEAVADHAPDLREIAPKQKQEQLRVSPKFLIDDTPSTRELADQLIKFEMGRLMDLGEEAPFDIPPGLSLSFKTGDDHRNLSLAHQSQLLALLRAAN